MLPCKIQAHSWQSFAKNKRLSTILIDDEACDILHEQWQKNVVVPCENKNTKIIQAFKNQGNGETILEEANQ